MPSLKIAGVDVENVQVGSTEVNAVYVGSTKLWERGYSAVMTVGYNTHIYTGSNTTHFEAGYGTSTTFPGTSSTVSVPYGSLTTTSIDLGNGNETIQLLRCTGTENNVNKTVLLEVSGGNNVNDGGWTTLKIGGFTYTRSSATYSSSSYLNTRRWTWSNTSNPFGTTSGATRNISIT